MRTVALLACLLVVALAFAGCSGKNKDDGKTSTSSSSSASHSSSSGSSTSKSVTHTSTGSSSASSSTGSTANHPPTGSISAAVNGTTAAFTLTGSDADSDTLVWDLTFGDGAKTNGTALPATVNHTYASTGNFSANFTVTDGKDPASYNVTVRLAAATGGSTLFTFSGDVSSNCASQCESCDPAGAAGCAPLATGAFGCTGFNLGSTPVGDMAQGIDCIWTPLPDGVVGHAFTATSTGGDPDLDFIDVCNVVDGVNTSSSWNAGPEAGTVPDGFPCVVLWEFNPVPMGSTITFTIA